jgi:hypothetical protein
MRTESQAHLRSASGSSSSAGGVPSLADLDRPADDGRLAAAPSSSSSSASPFAASPSPSSSTPDGVGAPSSSSSSGVVLGVADAPAPPVVPDFAVRLLIPDSAAGTVIGKHGSVIRALCENSGAIIRLSPVLQAGEVGVGYGVQERLVAVSGTGASVVSACVSIFHTLSADLRNFLYANPTVVYGQPYARGASSSPSSSSSSFGGSQASYAGPGDGRPRMGGARGGRGANSGSGAGGGWGAQQSLPQQHGDYGGGGGRAPHHAFPGVLEAPRGPYAASSSDAQHYPRQQQSQAHTQHGFVPGVEHMHHLTPQAAAAAAAAASYAVHAEGFRQGTSSQLPAPFDFSAGGGTGGRFPWGGAAAPQYMLPSHMTPPLPNMAGYAPAPGSYGRAGVAQHMQSLRFPHEGQGGGGQQGGPRTAPNNGGLPSTDGAADVSARFASMGIQ